MFQLVFKERVPCSTTSVDVQDVTSQRHRVRKGVFLEEILHENGRGVEEATQCTSIDKSQATFRSCG